MNWNRANDTMEQKAIKTDVIASEDAYFMATHVPFANLDILRGGNELAESGTLRWGEEEVYERLIYNPENLHRLIIVRGNNGTGKSHLIRWLRARLVNDKERYDPASEKVIFLRRLSNTIRGAIKQILDEDIVFDGEMRAKLEKFVASTQSMDAEKFKLNIYHQFIVAVSGDTDDAVYGRGLRRDIEGFLSDARVQQHMFRTGGPVERCYNAITAPSSQLFEGDAIFAEEDFKLPRAVKKEIKNSGSSEAQVFMEELDEDAAVAKLVKYLNSFTPKVIQGCADISSEGTKEVFLQLRRELKKQGKNLTIFIEDFTAFTGLDAELITVLASEHGGENSDLCRVTSVIGITDAYYRQFRGNFTDRVQYQVFVGEGAYGSSEFLVEMTARYLNAIYCEPKEIEDWFKQGANAAQLPVSGFTPGYEWDSTTVLGKELTLYPFNKRSVLSLYDALSEDGRGKTPRMFLLRVIQEQMTHFFDGKIAGRWSFPSEATIASPILLKNSGHDSAIDGLEGIPVKDRRRIKVLLQFWGNGTASSDGTSIGTVPKKYFTDVGLGEFSGFGGGEQGASAGEDVPAQEDEIGDAESAIITGADARQKKNLQARISDLNAWYSGGTKLGYSADFRKWIRDFLEESIDWQAEGVPAYIAQKRLSDPSAVYIEGQTETTTKERAIVRLERSTETKDLITAIVYHYYAKSWGFNSGLYFQLKAVSWLEANKKQIMSAVMQCADYCKPNPLVAWCASVEYLQAAFLGSKVSRENPVEIARALLVSKRGSAETKARASENRAWKDSIRYLASQEATYEECNEMFRESLRTFMGTDIAGNQRSVGFFRGAELLNVIEQLEAQKWKIVPVDTNGADTGVFRAASYLNSLLSKISAAAKEEDSLAQAVMERMKQHLGEVSSDGIAQLITSVAVMFNAFSGGHRFVPAPLKTYFDVDAITKAKEIMRAWDRIQKAVGEEDPVNKLVMYSDDPIALVLEFVENLDQVEQLAKSTTANVNQEKMTLAGGKDVAKIKQSGIESLKHASEAIKKLEVQYAD